jgi:tRNA(Ile)-lysidine synthase
MELVQKVLNTANKYAMLSEGDRILIGLSGGPDSVCLGIILQNEVEREKIFCKKFSDALGIDCSIKTIDVKNYAKEKKLSVQEAARTLRYQTYERISEELNAEKIALGHTADDRAETFLLWILRGSGPRGLSGIPPVRGKIIRPLIEIEKQEIKDFLTSFPLFMKHDSLPHYMTDSSNVDVHYVRNWMRQRVIPELKKQNPALIQTIGRISDILREEDEYMERIVTKTMMRLISRKSDDTIELFLAPLENLDKPVARRVLRRAIDETEGLRGIEYIHIEDILKLIKTGKSGDRIHLPKEIKAVKSYATLLITSRKPARLQTRKLTPPGKLHLDEVAVMLTAEIVENLEKTYDGKDTAVFDYDMLSLPLNVRRRKSGDFFYPAAFGKRKKLQDFFVDEKIPRDERDAIPIVVSGEDIIWVAGYRMDERYKAGGKTKKFLILRSFII